MDSPGESHNLLELPPIPVVVLLYARQKLNSEVKLAGSRELCPEVVQGLRGV